jgi:hypothetical protein
VVLAPAVDWPVVAQLTAVYAIDDALKALLRRTTGNAATGADMEMH